MFNISSTTFINSSFTVHSMKYVIITIIINLSLFTTVRCQLYSIVNLISRLNNCFQFDHNIFLLDSVIDNNGSIPAEDNKFIAQTVYIFNHSLDNSNSTHQLETMTEVTSRKAFLIVVVESLEFENNSQLLIQVKRIQRLSVNTRIGVFFQINITSNDILNNCFVGVGELGLLTFFVHFTQLSMTLRHH